jgi:hypothetical protein
MATKNAHWQAAFRRRMREAGLKAMTVWLPKEGAVRLARYPEKERGEVVTRALVLLESQGKFTGNDATLTGVLTGESRGEEEGKTPEGTLTVAELSTRLKRVEALLSTIISNSTGVLTGEAASEATSSGRPCPEIVRGTSITGEPTDKSTGEAVSEAINAQTVEPEESFAPSEAPPPPVTELTEPPAGLPLKRIPALTRRAKKLHAQGVSWREIAHRFNAEDVPTLSGIGQWHGSTVQHMIEKQGRE